MIVDEQSLNVEEVLDQVEVLLTIDISTKGETGVVYIRWEPLVVGNLAVNRARGLASRNARTNSKRMLKFEIGEIAAPG